MNNDSKRLAYLIAKHLQAEASSGMLDAETCDSLDVARNCILEAYKIDPENPDHVQLFESSASLRDLLKNSGAASTAAKATSSTSLEENEEDVKKAEAFKTEGNKCVASNKFEDAVKKYTQAIALRPLHAVYYSNRAAAYSQLQKHEKAAEDAQYAIQLDQSFAKAYSRLGHAHIMLKKYKEAADAYMQGLALEPDNQGMKVGLEKAESLLLPDKNKALSNDTSSASQSRGASSGAGAKPGFDFSQLMSNPQLVQAAAKMMQQNPEIVRMAQQMAGRNADDFDMSKISGLLSQPGMSEALSSFMKTAAGNDADKPSGSASGSGSGRGGSRGGRK